MQNCGISSSEIVSQNSVRIPDLWRGGVNDQRDDKTQWGTKLPPTPS